MHTFSSVMTCGLGYGRSCGRRKAVIVGREIPGLERIRRPVARRDHEAVPLPPAPKPSPLDDLVSAVGNRAFSASVSAGPHPALDPATPAWAEHGEMVLGPPSVLLSPEERAGVIRHEAVHVLQQRMAPADESRPRARPVRAARGDRAAVRAPSSSPRRRACWPRRSPARRRPGFDHLYAGEGEIVGEVTESGVTARAPATPT